MKHLLAGTALVALFATTALADERVDARGMTGREENCTQQAEIQNDANLMQTCNVAQERIPAAMDQIIFDYRFTHGRMAAAWAESHCKAEPAIPRNKWVCTEGDVTREYH